MPRRKPDCIGIFEERCKALAMLKREQAKKLPLGAEREVLEKEIRQLETATHIHKWLSSPELRVPD